MKKFLLTLAAMLLCMTSTVYAGKKFTFKKVNTTVSKPKSPDPVIMGESDAGELTIDFIDYVGDVIITVVDVTTNQTVCVENETVVSPDTVSVDLSTLPSSTYYIFIELDNGDCYYATIQI